MHYFFWAVFENTQIQLHDNSELSGMFPVSRIVKLKLKYIKSCLPITNTFVINKLATG